MKKTGFSSANREIFQKAQKKIEQQKRFLPKSDYRETESTRVNYKYNFTHFAVAPQYHHKYLMI